MVRSARTEAELFRNVCETAVNDLGFRLAWIGLAGDDFAVVPVAQAGYESGYLDSIRITWSDDVLGGGPTGRAIRERKPVIARCIATDERFAPWREDALRRGYASSAAIPLSNGAHCLGALNLYAAEPDAFDDDEIALLEELAADLLLGLLRVRASRELEQAAERAARAESVSTLLAAAAHDLNNFLQIATFTIDDARETTSPAERDADLEAAARAIESASALMAQVQRLSRRALEGSEPTAIDPALSALRPLLARLARRASLELDLAAPGASVRSTALDLERIVINLVVNAARAASTDGHIRVSTSLRRSTGAPVPAWDEELPPGDYVALTVADDGAGIAHDVLPRIFETHFSTKGESGMGLGLVSVLALARAAGGGVTVDSRPGEGARVTVLLPAVP